MTAAKKAAAAKATEPVEAAVAAGKETVETVVKAGTDAATKGVEKAVAMSQEQVAAAVKGLQDLNKEFFSMAQASLESNADVARKVFNCKSVEELVTLQNVLVTDSYSKVLDQGRKITDLSVKIAENASAPIASRVNATVDRFTKPLAA